jgi:GT2 family glycosyltransferase
LTAGAADVSRGHATLIEECLKAMSATDAAQVRHTIVIGDECDAGVRQRCEVESGAHVTVVPTVGGFNFATRCNEVAIRSSAEILVFVDDDFIPTNPLWLSELLAPFADPSVAITGGTLLCGDETIQHIGVGIVHGNFTHLFVEESLDHPRVAELIDMNREVDAVTGACFAMRSDVFYHVGGFFDGFPLNYSDVDLCLKARAAGYSVIHVGAPLGYHLESKTRHGVTLAEEMTLFHSRWSADIVSEYPGDYSF